METDWFCYAQPTGHASVKGNCVRQVEEPLILLVYS